jgi:hypothetical protein
MMDKAEVQRWLDTIPDGSSIAIDEGGLSIVEIDASGEQTDAYLEVGMTPAEEDMLNPDEDAEDEDEDGDKE